MIVRAHEAEQRIVQPRLLRVEEHVGRCAVRCPARDQTAVFIGLPVSSSGIGIARVAAADAAFLEDAKDIARLADLKARQRQQFRQKTLASASLLR